MIVLAPDFLSRGYCSVERSLLIFPLSNTNAENQGKAFPVYNHLNAHR